MNNLLPDNDDVLVFKHSQEGGSVWGEVVLNRPGRKNAIVVPIPAIRNRSSAAAMVLAPGQILPFGSMRSK